MSSAFIISSVGIVAYSWTYWGRESSRLNPAFFMKNGCMTSGVASPSCRIVKRSILRVRGAYTSSVFFFPLGAEEEATPEGPAPPDEDGSPIAPKVTDVGDITFAEGGGLVGDLPVIGAEALLSEDFVDSGDSLLDIEPRVRARVRMLVTDS